MTTAAERRLGSADRPSSRTLRQVAIFATIGLASTAAYVVLYSSVRGVTDAALANFIALGLTAVANTAVNRRITFGIRSRAGFMADQLAGLGAFALALAITTGAIALLGLIAPDAGRRIELAVLVSASVVATLARFIVLRSWLGRDRTAAIASLDSTKEVLQ